MGILYIKTHDPAKKWKIAGAAAVFTAAAFGLYQGYGADEEPSVPHKISPSASGRPQAPRPKAEKMIPPSPSAAKAPVRDTVIADQTMQDTTEEFYVEQKRYRHCIRLRDSMLHYNAFLAENLDPVKKFDHLRFISADLTEEITGKADLSVVIGHVKDGAAEFVEPSPFTTDIYEPARRAALLEVQLRIGRHQQDYVRLWHDYFDLYLAEGTDGLGLQNRQDQILRPALIQAYGVISAYSVPPPSNTPAGEDYYQAATIFLRFDEHPEYWLDLGTTWDQITRLKEIALTATVQRQEYELRQNEQQYRVLHLAPC